MNTNIVDDIINMCDYNDFGARKIDKIINNVLEDMIINSIINEKKSVNIKSLKSEISI